MENVSKDLGQQQSRNNNFIRGTYKCFNIFQAAVTYRTTYQFSRNIFHKVFNNNRSNNESFSIIDAYTGKFYNIVLYG